MTSPTFIGACRAIDARQRIARAAVGEVTPSAVGESVQNQLSTDEGVNYFTAKAGHDRANALFLARLNELLAEKRAA